MSKFESALDGKVGKMGGERKLISPILGAVPMISPPRITFRIADQLAAGEIPAKLQQLGEFTRDNPEQQDNWTC